MVINNHSGCNKKKLDLLLRQENISGSNVALSQILEYARFMADIEKVLVVVSDMKDGKSHIFAGGFARNLELGDYQQENSIWESRILSLMLPQEQEYKYIAELRFFHFLRHLPACRKTDYYLVSKLRFRYTDGKMHEVLHRMYYIFDGNNENIIYAICIYGPLAFDFGGKSYVVNSISGVTEELDCSGNDTILSRRESQVLSLIYTGLKSAEIAERLNISIHTVSRHRQEIIGKLQVKNSHEACRLAKALKII